MALNEGFEVVQTFCEDYSCAGHKWAFHRTNNYEDCYCDPLVYVDPGGVVIIIKHRYPEGVHNNITKRPPNA